MKLRLALLAVDHPAGLRIPVDRLGRFEVPRGVTVGGLAEPLVLATGGLAGAPRLATISMIEPSPFDAATAYEQIIANAKKYKADARIVGVQVQQMIKGGQEVIVGAMTDPSFGKLVAFGMGGVLVEVLKDVTFRLAPATRDDALSMLDGIQAHEMLKGVRGGDPVNRDALADVIVKVSQLVSDFPEIVELESVRACWRAGWRCPEMRRSRRYR